MLSKLAEGREWKRKEMVSRISNLVPGSPPSTISLGFQFELPHTALQMKPPWLTFYLVLASHTFVGAQGRPPQILIILSSSYLRSGHYKWDIWPSSLSPWKQEMSLLRERYAPASEGIMRGRKSGLAAYINKTCYFFNSLPQPQILFKFIAN